MSEPLRVLVLLTLALLWVIVGVTWAAESGIFARLQQDWRGCPPIRQVLAALAVAAAVAYAGEKRGVVIGKEQEVRTEFSSSAVATGETMKEGKKLRADSLQPTPCSLSDEDISRGYRLVSVTTNGAHSYEIPLDARTVGTWHQTDAHDAVAKASLDEPFPLGGQIVTSLWAHVWGKARPQLRNASNELIAIGTPMFARRGVSRLWTATTPSNTVLLTWQNFFFKGERSKKQEASADGQHSTVAADETEEEDRNRHASSLLSAPSPFHFSRVSAQLEIFHDGSFVARSNAIARAYRRVNPDDWDGDGIPNAEDDNPRVAAESPRFGPRQSLPQGAHTNNYYWVDLVVQDADALVSFAGDAPSNLPDPSFVARAGETNRVALLIGKNYAVRCLLPATVVGKSDPEVVVGWDNARTTVCWPVRFKYVDAVLPSALREARRRTRAAGRGGAMPRVVPTHLHGGVYAGAENFCCWEPALDGTPIFACDGACGCGGCSTGDMTFTLEGYAFTFGGWSCTCPRLLPNAPGDGGGRPLPFECELRPFERVEFTNTYRAVRPSGGEGDIVVTATFEENGTGETRASEDRATAVRVELRAAQIAVGNACLNRHKFGVNERVNCYQTPSSPSVTWMTPGGGCMTNGLSQYHCPLQRTTNPLKVHCLDIDYMPQMEVVEPQTIEPRNIGYWVQNVSLGAAGGIGLEFDLYVRPLDVSFAGLAVEEIPYDKGSRLGYFANNHFSNLASHTYENGAGRWLLLSVTHLFGVDAPGIYTELPRMTPDGVLTNDVKFGWAYGTLTWPIPYGWNEGITSRDAVIRGRFAEDTVHENVIFETGKTGVRKLQQVVTREIDGTVYLNGTKMR